MKNVSKQLAALGLTAGLGAGAAHGAAWCELTNYTVDAHEHTGVYLNGVLAGQNASLIVLRHDRWHIRLQFQSDRQAPCSRFVRASAGQTADVVLRDAGELCGIRAIYDGDYDPRGVVAFAVPDQVS